MIIADGVNGDGGGEKDKVLCWIDIAITRELAQSTVATPQLGWQTYFANMKTSEVKQKGGSNLKSAIFNL